MKNFISLTLVLLVASNAYAFGKKDKETEQVQRSPEEAAANLIKSNDANKDGKLAKNEVNINFRVKRFKAADTNQDNYLDQTELTNWFTKTTQAQATQNTGTKAE